MKLAKLSPWLLLALLVASASAVSAKDKKPENEYPNATRSEPKPDMSASDQRDLNKAADLLNASKPDDAQPIVDKVLGDSKSKYAQAFAHELKGQILYDKDKTDEALAEYRKAIDLDALPNTQQFQVLYTIAQVQLQNEKYKDSLASIEQWEKLTGKQSADELALKANAYYRTDQFQPAIDTMKKALSMTDKVNDSWNQVLMASYFELKQYDQAAALTQQQLSKDPTNKKLLTQLATIYLQADKPQQAIDMLSKAKAQGLFTTGDDYLQLAKLYAAAEKPKDAAATLKEGLGKGVVKPSYDVYKLQGDVCTQAEDDACAIEGYSKAAPMAEDGNVAYQLGYLYYYSDHSTDAVQALNTAIEKGGLRQEGEAYLLRGDAENDTNQSAAAKADWGKAAGFPSTKTMAEQRLKALKGGVKIQKAKRKKG